MALVGLNSVVGYKIRCFLRGFWSLRAAINERYIHELPLVETPKDRRCKEEIKKQRNKSSTPSRNPFPPV